MYIFAHVVESNGRQVLFMKNKTDDNGIEVPKLSIIFHTDDECQLDVGMCFPDGSGESWDNLDNAFELIKETGQKIADSITSKIEPDMTAFELVAIL